MRASIFGGLVQTFYVYELDDSKAATLATTAISATKGDIAEAVKLLTIRELVEHGLKPGEVKQCL